MEYAARMQKAEDRMQLVLKDKVSVCMSVCVHLVIIDTSGWVL